MHIRNIPVPISLIQMGGAILMPGASTDSISGSQTQRAAGIPRAFSATGKHRTGYSKVEEGESLWVVPHHHHFIWPAVCDGLHG
jgi:hypothetical protein